MDISQILNTNDTQGMEGEQATDGSEAVKSAQATVDKRPRRSIKRPVRFLDSPPKEKKVKLFIEKVNRQVRCSNDAEEEETVKLTTKKANQVVHNSDDAPEKNEVKLPTEEANGPVLNLHGTPKKETSAVVEDIELSEKENLTENKKTAVAKQKSFDLNRLRAKHLPQAKAKQNVEILEMHAGFCIQSKEAAPIPSTATSVHSSSILESEDVPNETVKKSTTPRTANILRHLQTVENEVELLSPIRRTVLSMKIQDFKINLKEKRPVGSRVSITSSRTSANDVMRLDSAGGRVPNVKENDRPVLPIQEPNKKDVFKSKRKNEVNSAEIISKGEVSYWLLREYLDTAYDCRTIQGFVKNVAIACLEPEEILQAGFSVTQSQVKDVRRAMRLVLKMRDRVGKMYLCTIIRDGENPNEAKKKSKKHAETTSDCLEATDEEGTEAENSTNENSQLNKPDKVRDYGATAEQRLENIKNYLEVFKVKAMISVGLKNFRYDTDHNRIKKKTNKQNKTMNNYNI